MQSSPQVARAARDCRVPLVRRGPRGASLTAAGALLAAHGRVIDDEVRLAGAALADLLGQLPVRLRIGAFQARAQFDHAAAAAGFTPKVRFETESYDVAQALVGTGIGVALISRPALTHLPGTTHRELAPPPIAPPAVRGDPGRHLPPPPARRRRHGSGGPRSANAQRKNVTKFLSRPVARSLWIA